MSWKYYKPCKTLEEILDYTDKVDGCWLWKGSRTFDGYGRWNISGNKNGKLHRHVYSGKHPEEDITNKVIRHTCDNPLCINPEHLVSGSVKDNVRDMDLRNRRGHSKLTFDQVRAIRLIGKTLTQVEIGKMFGVDYRTVSYILKRLTWKYVN